ncbi:uncharacterized protein TNIN_478181 [Trichonephila inaurata madagascariensis]|uniref:Uncharacterized protein n=1 Tax=Trichonephila inaurata madagascariensis TaxID=2747483 RepID=A0A8X6YG25_9ARAC|nr:uncharacterized protein TNIN_478181 [Trichonephila inaurata madagascariensis]
MLPNIMYILPMLLGRTFDARFDRVGIDIFPQSELDRARVIEEPESISRYETSDSAEEVRNLLEVSADLALKVKAGKVEFKGTGSYLKDTSKLGRIIEILTRLKFKTVTVALPPEVQPFPSWTQKNRNDLGTHFVRSITYGGELLASIRFKANKDTDFNAISAEIQSNFNGGDAQSLVAEGKLEKVQSRLKDKASMEISYYATVPLKGVPNTIEGLRSLVRDFDEHVKEVNDGWGVPIRVELMELSSLGGVNSSEFKFIKDRALESELADVEHEFDDLRKASTMLTEWYRTLPTSITPEQESEINKLYSRIQKVLRPYYDSIGKLNIEEGPEQQVKAAREAYREGKLSALPGRFTKEFLRLKKKIVVSEKKMYGTGTVTYVRWGSKECPSSPMIFKLDTGHMAATSNRGTGGASDYLCLPQNPVYPDEKPAFGNDASTFVTGVKYGLLDDHPFTDHDARYFYGKGVPCATCHLTNRTLIHVFPAQDECPEDWIYEYSGYLMAGSNLPGAHICMNDAPEAYEENIEEQQAHSLSLVHISEMNEGLPKPPYEKKAAVKCIVCSK